MSIEWLRGLQGPRYVETDAAENKLQQQERTITTLRQQLAERDAEIERLRHCMLCTTPDEAGGGGY